MKRFLWLVWGFVFYRGWCIWRDPLRMFWRAFLEKTKRRNLIEPGPVPKVDEGRFVELARIPKAGDRVRVRDPKGFVHPNICLVMGAVSCMGKVTATIQPSGLVQTMIIGAESLVYCPDAKERAPIRVARWKRGTVNHGRAASRG